MDGIEVSKALYGQLRKMAARDNLPAYGDVRNYGCYIDLTYPCESISTHKKTALPDKQGGYYGGDAPF